MMRRYSRTLGLMAIVVLAVGILSNCTSADVLNVIVPSKGYVVQKDIAYGRLERQKLDIYRPDATQQKKDTVIVFFYGGSWKKGTKDDYLFVGQALASRGYVTVVADYRLYPEVAFPAFVEDSAEAVAWTHRHIAQYGGNPRRMVVMGHSAGAYNAVMVGLDTPYTRHIVPAGVVKAVVGIAGPYDFLPFTDSTIEAIFKPEQDAKTQPINWVKAKLPPMFLVSGEDDEVVAKQNSLRMASALAARKNYVETKLYPDTGHIGIILSLAAGFQDRTTLLDDVERFIAKQASRKKS